MPQINLLNESSNSKSIDQNSATLINMYLVGDNDQGKYQVNAYYTPGSTLFSAGTTSLRAIWTQQGVTYGVDGNKFFSVNSSGTRTTLGTLNTASGWCKIRGVQNEIFIVDTSNGYCYLTLTSSFTTISSTGGTIEYITVTAGGNNYTNPTVSFTGGGVGAILPTAIAAVTAGSITSITAVTLGSMLSTPPNVVITDSTGTGATAIAVTQTVSFPTSVQDIVCQDEFGAVMLGTSQQWQLSAVDDLTTWPSLSFASTNGSANYNIAMESLHREIWLLGVNTTEIWDNQGQVNFSFLRNPSVYIEYGCAARSSLAKGNNTIYFLGRNASGTCVVIGMQSYTPSIISNPSLDYQISTYSTISDAIGFVYQQEGHEFYVLTFPTAGTTWVYDISSQMWHQRQSLTGGNQTNWLASCHTHNYNLNLIGDLNTGNIYKLDMSNYTENGAAITRTVITHPFYNTGEWSFVDRLQIDFDNTPGINLSNWSLSISRDGGRTFGTPKVATPVQDPTGLWRVYWTRLGKSKTFVFKLTTNANMACIILGAWAYFRSSSLASTSSL